MPFMIATIVYTLVAGTPALDSPTIFHSQYSFKTADECYRFLVSDTFAEQRLGLITAISEQAAKKADAAATAAGTDAPLKPVITATASCVPDDRI